MDDQQQTSSTSCEKEIKLEIDDFNYNVANAEKSADAGRNIMQTAPWYNLLPLTINLKCVIRILYFSDPGEEDFLRVVKVIKARKRTKDTSNGKIINKF